MPSPLVRHRRTAQQSTELGVGKDNHNVAWLPWPFPTRRLTSVQDELIWTRLFVSLNPKGHHHKCVRRPALTLVRQFGRLHNEAERRLHPVRPNEAVARGVSERPKLADEVRSLS